MLQFSAGENLIKNEIEAEAEAEAGVDHEVALSKSYLQGEDRDVDRKVLLRKKSTQKVIVRKVEEL